MKKVGYFAIQMVLGLHILGFTIFKSSFAKTSKTLSEKKKIAKAFKQFDEHKKAFKESYEEITTQKIYIAIERLMISRNPEIAKTFNQDFFDLILTQIGKICKKGEGKCKALTKGLRRIEFKVHKDLGFPPIKYGKSSREILVFVDRNQNWQKENFILVLNEIVETEYLSKLENLKGLEPSIELIKKLKKLLEDRTYSDRQYNAALITLLQKSKGKVRKQIEGEFWQRLKEQPSFYLDEKDQSHLFNFLKSKIVTLDSNQMKSIMNVLNYNDGEDIEIFLDGILKNLKKLNKSARAMIFGVTPPDEDIYELQKNPRIERDTLIRYLLKHDSFAKNLVYEKIKLSSLENSWAHFYLYKSDTDKFNDLYKNRLAGSSKKLQNIISRLDFLVRLNGDLYRKTAKVFSDYLWKSFQKSKKMTPELFAGLCLSDEKGLSAYYEASGVNEKLSKNYFNDIIEISPYSMTCAVTIKSMVSSKKHLVLATKSILDIKDIHSEDSRVRRMNKRKDYALRDMIDLLDEKKDRKFILEIKEAFENWVKANPDQSKNFTNFIRKLKYAS